MSRRDSTREFVSKPGRGRGRNSLIGSPYSRRLRVEQLEERRMLAVFSVDNLNDTGMGSLREAITTANGNGEADTINFTVTGTIPIDSQLPTIVDDLTITGPGSALLTIDAQLGGDGLANGNGWRLFDIDDGDDGQEIDVTLSGLSMIGGDILGTVGASDAGSGGAIRNLENLTVADSSISGNRTTGFSYSDGGAIWSSLGELVVTGSTISDNRALDNGGGIFLNSGSATVTGSTVSSNTVSARGAGIFLNSGLATVTGSTISGNSAFSGGGGIFLSSGSAIVTGSTISGNSTSVRGGGIYNSGTANVTSSTISDNSAYSGGGILNNGTATLNNSTISDNTASDSGGGISTSGTTMVTSSIVASNAAASDPNVSGSLNTNAFNLIDVDPLLGPLADNGGATQTHALLTGSPAIDAGDPAFVGPPNYDQRGFNFSRVVGVRIDIGAFESGATSADFDTDGDINGFDFLAWQRGFGDSPVVHSDGDANVDGVINGSDLAVWTASYGQVETILLAAADTTSDESSTSLSSVSAPVLFESASSETPTPAKKATTPEPSAAALIDAALAVEWLGQFDEPVEGLILEDAQIEANFADNVKRADLQLVANAPAQLQATSPAADEADLVDEPWLAEELLERVFGDL